MRKLSLLLFFTIIISEIVAQNSKVGDGFGGRLWYKPSNFRAGSYSAYSICGDSNQLYGWGFNIYGQLGDGTTTPSPGPVKALGMTNVDYFSAGYYVGVIKKDKTAWVWGMQLGSTPIRVLDNVKFLDAGQNSITCVMEDGTVRSIGASTSGTFGNGNSPGIYVKNPAKMKYINSAVRVANGLYTTTILLKDGTVWVTGSNSMGGLGLSANSMIIYEPQLIPSLKNIVEIQANVHSNLALDNNGDVYYWGKNFATFPVSQNFPVKLPQLKNIVAISGANDGDFFLALDANHNCYAWGDNQYGQCGSNISNTWVQDPVLVATNVIDIMAGESFSYIVKTDKSLWAAGASNKASIWMNLSDVKRSTFTLINPEIAPSNLCLPLIKSFKEVSQKISICYGDSLKVGSHVYKNNGNYSDTFTKSNGPDSIVITQLEIFSPSYNFQSFSLCLRDSCKVGNHTYLKQGIYKDTFTNYLGCDSILTTNVKIKPVSTSDKTFLICPGDSIYINSHLFTDIGKYKDTLLNYLGCDSIITNSIEFYKEYTMCKNPLFFIPNAFSPNQNDINDYFGIVGGDFKEIKMQIYNRWGEKIFDATSPDVKWDGTYQNKPCQQSIYLYLINLTFKDGTKFYTKGTLTLLR